MTFSYHTSEFASSLVERVFFSGQKFRLLLHLWLFMICDASAGSDCVEHCNIMHIFCFNSNKEKIWDCNFLIRSVTVWTLSWQILHHWKGIVEWYNYMDCFKITVLKVIQNLIPVKFSLHAILHLKTVVKYYNSLGNFLCKIHIWIYFKLFFPNNWKSRWCWK